jgi:hypothetical protein
VWVHNPPCTRGARDRLRRRFGVDPLNVRGGRRVRRPPERFGASVRRYGPAAPGLPGGRYVNFGSRVQRSIRITLTGTYPGDFAAADTGAGITRAYRTGNQLTWHHVPDVAVTPAGQYEGTMQLLDRATHQQWPHWGGAEQYRAATGAGY